jgi:hypothetical protein
MDNKTNLTDMGMAFIIILGILAILMCLLLIPQQMCYNDCQLEAYEKHFEECLELNRFSSDECMHIAIGQSF